MTSREQQVFAKAMGDVLKDRLTRVTRNALDGGPRKLEMSLPDLVTHVDPTPVQITNEVGVPVVEVHVDTSPLAAAMDRSTEATRAMTEMLSQLLVVLADQKAPQVRVVNRVDAPVIPPSPPAVVNVEVPKPKRSKTKVNRDDKDDMTSTVTEYEY